MSDYSAYNRHLTLSDPYIDDESIIAGFAIRDEDFGSFMVDFNALVRRYGVTFEELLENDWESDSSAAAAHKASVPDPIPVIEADAQAQRRLVRGHERFTEPYLGS